MLHSNSVPPSGRLRALGRLVASIRVPAENFVRRLVLLAALIAASESARAEPAATGRQQAFFLGGSEFGDRAASANQAGSRISRPYVAAGVDFLLHENTRGGLAVGYADGKDDFDNHAGTTRTRTTAVHAFASALLGGSGVALDGIVGCGWGRIDISRNLPSVGRVAAAAPDGRVWSAALKASKALGCPWDSLLGR